MRYFNIILVIMFLTGCQVTEDTSDEMTAVWLAQYGRVDNPIENGMLPVACPTGSRVGVFSTAGQSNSTNIIYGQLNLNNTIYMFFDGYCYETTGTLLGATGFDDSSAIWVLLADKLIDAGYYDDIILTAAGVGGSSIAEWQPGGIMYPYFINQQQQLKNAGYKTHAILWQHGETDSALNTSYQVYRDGLTNMYTAMLSDGVNVPLFAAQSTYCMGYNGTYVDIRNAVVDTAETVDGIYLGADTDWIVGDNRSDDCHFNYKGAEIATDMWMIVIENAIKNNNI